MNRTSDILVLTRDEATIRRIAEAIGVDAGVGQSSACATLADLQRRMDHEHVRAALIDIDGQDHSFFDALGELANRFPAVRFVVLSQKSDDRLMLLSMQAGARHFMRKDEIESELRHVFHRLLPDSHANRGSGSLITILAAGGGCGATTVAVNLSYELAVSNDTQSLVIDLDWHYGGAAGLLGVVAHYGVIDVLVDGDRVDADLVRSTAVPVNDRMHLLASPATVDFEHLATPEFHGLDRLIQKARQVYDFIVIDAPGTPMPAASVLANASDRTFILLESNVEDIRIARSLYGGLIRRGAPTGAVIPVVNRSRGRRDPISRNEIMRAIDCTELVQVRNDYKSALAAVNMGTPLASCAPRSPLRQDIQELAKLTRVRPAMRRAS